jgi:hypothetical protein
MADVIMQSRYIKILLGKPLSSCCMVYVWSGKGIWEKGGDEIRYEADKGK